MREFTRDKAREDRARHWANMESAFTEASKACLVLNAGSVVAMLGFLQNVLSKAPNRPFKVYALAAAFIYLIGTVSVIIAFATRSGLARAILNGNPEGANAFDNASSNSVIFSMLAFVFGSVVAGIGIAIAL